MKKIIALLLTATLIFSCSFAAFAAIVPDNPAGETVDIVKAGDTMVYNEGEVRHNHGSIKNNTTGTVDTNEKDGYIESNDSEVRVNKGDIAGNNGTVKRNSGTARVGVNFGDIKLNTATVLLNDTIGTIEINTVDGVIEDNQGTVVHNYGLIEKDGSDTNVCGVTYGSMDEEDPESSDVLKNEQKHINDTYVVLTAAQAGAKMAGYEFVNWMTQTTEGNIGDGKYAASYLGGETIKIIAPIWFEAVWKLITTPQEEATKTAATSSGGAAWTSAPSKAGSADAPISNGNWKDVNGKFKYYVNGEPLKNTLACIQYVPEGATAPVSGIFFFNKDGNMATGWQQINGIWFYFNEAKGAAYGALVTNALTPDGYLVGADGAWIQ